MLDLNSRYREGLWMCDWKVCCGGFFSQKRLRRSWIFSERAFLMRQKLLSPVSLCSPKMKAKQVLSREDIRSSRLAHAEMSGDHNARQPKVALKGATSLFNNKI